MAGAVFWHFVGFWGFVDRLLLDERPAPPAAGRLASHGPAETGPVVAPTAGSAPDAAHCGAIALDRATGRTWAEPCRLEMDLVAARVPLGRGDLGVVAPASGPAAWAATTTLIVADPIR